VPTPCILCRLEDIPEGTSKGFAADPKAYYADILVVRTGQGVYAYRNNCPHTGAPMEWQPDQFLDYTGTLIQCSIHAAQFRIRDGYCLAGPCEGQYLRKVAVEVRDGMIVALEDSKRRYD
jgi:nitrite reductase/ring-hydroxylating ferredoxin subunit